MKISHGRPTFMKSLKKYPLVKVLLRGSGHLFQCTLQLKYTYKGLIEPHFDYCRAVWDEITQQLSEKLQKLQNRAIRVITKSSYDTSSRLLLNSLGWDNLSCRRAKQKANLMYKCINNLAPAYLCNLFVPRLLNYDFRNSKKTLLLPKPRTDYLKHSFSYSGAILWNNLPEEINTSKGPFTWKEDDPSAGIILALGSSERGMFSAFSLHVKGCIWPQC